MKLTSHVIKSGKTLCQIRRKHVYEERSGDKGINTALLCCMCASGMHAPQVAETHMPSLECLSPKGWINADLFAEWFQHFTECTLSHRPIVLIMNSYSSHITPWNPLKERPSCNIYILHYTPTANTGCWCLQATERSEERRGEIFDRASWSKVWPLWLNLNTLLAGTK